MCKATNFSVMSSSPGETAVSVNGGTLEGTSGEPVKVGVKRKRTSSTSEEVSENKKTELVNGVSGEKEEEEREKVAILDAGAQYGKVRDLTP